MNKIKFKEGDLIRICSPNPLRTDKSVPKRLFEPSYEVNNWLMDQNHGKLGIIVKISLHNTDNPVYTIIINNRAESYGQHCLREV